MAQRKKLARIISRGIEGVDGVSSVIRTVESEYADDAIIDIDELTDVMA